MPAHTHANPKLGIIHAQSICESSRVTHMYLAAVTLPEASRAWTPAADIQEETELGHAYSVLVNSKREAEEQAEARQGTGDEDGACLLSRVAAAWESVLECLQRCVLLCT